MRPLRVGILTSPSPRAVRPESPAAVERAIDRRSAQDLGCAISAAGHEPTVIEVARAEDLPSHPKIARVDLCLVAAHGSLGGTGALAAMLARLGIPYCAPTPEATALAFDKASARARLAQHGLPVPTTVLLEKDTPPPARSLALLGWPCVAKPRRGAHGLHVTGLYDKDAVERFAAAPPDEDFLLERCVEGLEVQVVLLGGRVLGAMEVHRGLENGGAMMVCPPQLGTVALDGVYTLARRAARALDLCTGPVRVDVLCSPRDNESILEVEPLPPLHRDGVVARVAHAAGLPYERLVASLLDHLALPARPTAAIDALGAYAPS